MARDISAAETFDVVIVGYGPGGQMLAGLLARKGWKVLAVERYPTLYGLPRAGHVDHEALRMVQSVTDPKPYLDTLWEVRGDYVWLNAERKVLMLQPEHDTGDAVCGYYSDFSQWQPNLEATLDRAARAAGADIRLGRECVALEQDTAGVAATIRRTELANGALTPAGEAQTVRARYLVGMDGANSFVRRTLGIERVDWQFDERWLVCDMETIRPVVFDPNIAQICDPARPRMLMPLGRTHRRFEWMLMPHETDEEMSREEVAWKFLEEFGVSPQNHRIARNVVYRFQARIAERWRVRRVMIGGDAAHTMPPFAGQGMLSSLRDANNLAWKLDLAMRGTAPEILLDSYEAERRAHVEAWTRISIAEGRVSCELDPQEAAKRDERFLSGEKLPAPQPPKMLSGCVPGHTSPLAHPLSGTLGLQARVAGPEKDGLLDEVVGASRFVLLTMSGRAQDHLDGAGIARLEALGAALLEILPQGSAPRPGAIVDTGGAYAAYFAKHGISALLTRPDFVVFGAVRSLRDLPLLADTLFARLEARPDSPPAQRLLATGLRYAEAPRWHGDRLWFSDVHDFKLKTVGLDGRVDIVADIPGRPSGMGFLPDGRVLLATALDRKLLVVDGSAVSEAADLSHLAQGVLNDMVVDGAGRAYVGDTGFDIARGQAPRPGRILLWRQGEVARSAAEEVVFPNGMVVTPDGRELLVAETMARRITRFAIEADGSLTGRRIFAELDMPPDGICLDTAGGLWIGMPESGRFVRLNPDGTLDRAIAGQFPFTVAPMLGGADRRTLFLCSADTDLRRLSRRETTGRIDTVEAEMAGAGWP
jgi:2-polyprenyl-6-methoxyphenol hydroxylase-like FAD-dependent oxidoreductase/sugar lactone lactonase YvrE